MRSRVTYDGVTIELPPGDTRATELASVEIFATPDKLTLTVINPWYSFGQITLTPDELAALVIERGLIPVKS